MHLYHPSRLQSSSVIERHHHVRPYATVVIAGSYEEAGDAGRFRVEPGDVLFHGPFAAHSDRVSGKTVTVLDLPLPLDADRRPGRGRLADPDHLMRMVESDRVAATVHLLAAFRPSPQAERELPDLLANALRSVDPPTIGDWADRIGRSREHISREFLKLYGVSPARYRSEARARNAWHLIMTDNASLAAIAADAGFADQAHMTRAIGALTGSPPTAWRMRKGEGSQDKMQGR